MFWNKEKEPLPSDVIKEKERLKLDEIKSDLDAYRMVTIKLIRACYDVDGLISIRKAYRDDYDSYYDAYYKHCTQDSLEVLTALNNGYNSLERIWNGQLIILERIANIRSKT